MLTFITFLFRVYTATRSRISDLTATSSNASIRSLVSGASSDFGSSDLPSNGKPQDNAKQIALRLLDFAMLVLGFFESMTVFLSVMTWGIYLLLVLLIVVLLVVIFSLLNVATHAVSSPVFHYNPNNVSTVAASQGTLAWTSAQLAEYGITLTPYEKNLYRLGILANQAVSGYGGSSPLMDVPGSTLDERIKFVLGVSSVETGMQFYNDGFQGNNLMLDPGNVDQGDSYGLFGISESATLSSYFSPNVVNAIQSQYNPSSTPLYPAAFAPWGEAMSAAAQDAKLQDVLTSYTQSQIKQVASQWGIKANLTEFTVYSDFFLELAYYQGIDAGTDTDPLLNFFAALFCASSPIDSQRTFSAWSLPISSNPANNDYAESDVRDSIDGGSGKDGLALVSTPMQLTGLGPTPLLLNGKPLTVPLWNYLGQLYWSNPGFKQAWANAQSYSAIGGGGIGARVLNFHYGFIALLEANRIEQQLASQMHIMTAASSGFHVSPGQGQAIIDGQSSNHWIITHLSGLSSPELSLIEQLMPTFGTSNFITNPDNPARLMGYKDSKFGVPFYGQNSSFGETYGNLDWYPNDETFNLSGCMVDSNAYAASALTGKLINPAEMDALMLIEGGIQYAGVDNGNMPKVYALLGLKAWDVSADQQTEWGSTTSPTAVGQDIASTVSAGGIAVIRVTSGVFTPDSSHFIAITSVTHLNGQDYYTVYSSYQPQLYNQVFSTSQLESSQYPGSDVLLISK